MTHSEWLREEVGTYPFFGCIALDNKQAIEIADALDAAREALGVAYRYFDRYAEADLRDQMSAAFIKLEGDV